MNDLAVRKAVHKKLLKSQHMDSETLVLDEFEICGGACRVDIAVFNGVLHGYELKSANDTLDRLPSQINYYSAVMDKVTLVVAENHLVSAMDIVPDWWGVKVVREGSKGGVHIDHERLARKNRKVDSSLLVQMLWKDECINLLDRWGLSKGHRSKPRYKLWDVVSKNIPENELRKEVNKIIKGRGSWREKLVG